jgi:hypothetical protein
MPSNVSANFINASAFVLPISILTVGTFFLILILDFMFLFKVIPATSFEERHAMKKRFAIQTIMRIYFLLMDINVHKKATLLDGFFNDYFKD